MSSAIIYICIYGPSKSGQFIFGEEVSRKADGLGGCGIKALCFASVRMRKNLPSDVFVGLVIRKGVARDYDRAVWSVEEVQIGFVGALPRLLSSRSGLEWFSGGADPTINRLSLPRSRNFSQIFASALVPHVGGADLATLQVALVYIFRSRGSATPG